MRPERFFRAIFLFCNKLPRWLLITVITGLFVVYYILGHIFGLVAVAVVVLSIWFYGRHEYHAKARKTFIIKYITGTPIFPKPLSNMKLFVDERGLRLKYFVTEARVGYTDITRVEAETRTQITRTASMMKGAIGLAIGGPLGAMVGMGIGSKHDDSQYFVSVIYKDELGEDNMLLFQQQSNLIGNAYEIVTAIKEARHTFLLHDNLHKRTLSNR